MKVSLCSFAQFRAVLLTLLSIFACAGNVFAGVEDGRLRIDFLSTPDWIEISRIEKIPEKLTIRLVRKDEDAIDIFTFDQDGPAFPELVSIFKSKVHEKKILFAIVKWRYYLPGANTEGDYYEVHGYEAKRNDVGKTVFLENKKYQIFMALDSTESKKVNQLISGLKMPPRSGVA